MRLKIASIVYLRLCLLWKPSPEKLCTGIYLLFVVSIKTSYVKVNEIAPEGAEKRGLRPSSEKYSQIYHIAVHILRSVISHLCWGGKDKIYRKGWCSIAP